MVIAEEWREIDVFDGRFLVSNRGRVKQALRYDPDGKQRGGRILLLNKRDKDGYCIVQLRHKNKIKYFRVHRLVAQAFIPNPEGKPYVDHINTVKDDNRVENLRWVTVRENANNPLTIEHNRKAQTGKKMSLESSIKKRAAMQVKPVLQFTTDGEFVQEFGSVKEAGCAMGSRCGSIVNCCKGRNKTAAGFVWRYKVC